MSAFLCIAICVTKRRGSGQADTSRNQSREPPKAHTRARESQSTSQADNIHEPQTVNRPQGRCTRHENVHEQAKTASTGHLCGWHVPGGLSRRAQGASGSMDCGAAQAQVQGWGHVEVPKPCHNSRLRGTVRHNCAAVWVSHAWFVTKQGLLGADCTSAAVSQHPSDVAQTLYLLQNASFFPGSVQGTQAETLMHNNMEET